MPRFAANLSMMYPEHALPDRVGAAARDGFAAVEVQSPYEVDAAELRRALDAARCPLVLMNAAGGNASRGERGLAALPGREPDFREAVALGLDYARAVRATRVHVMAGLPPAGARDVDVRATYVNNLRHACDLFAPHGIEVLIEPINTRDMPGYWLNFQQQAADVIDEVDRPNLGLQMDFYHLQIMEGDLIRHLRQFFSFVRHVQVAGVPERHEPDTGEVDFGAIFAALDRLGYCGWVGCEYRPARGVLAGGTSAGLDWIRRLV